jgi:hypothetical protein
MDWRVQNDVMERSCSWNMVLPYLRLFRLRRCATVELLLDDDFMTRFRAGVAEMERGDLRSFEDVFGEPL